MEREYGERYRHLFENHWWWRARTEYIVETLRRLQPHKGWTNILDIGCGDALFFDRLSEFGEVEGVEPSGELISPQNTYRSRIHVCPFDEHFRPKKKYSLILMLDVLEHLDEPVVALRQVADLLAPEGIFVATVPAFMALWTNHDIFNHHRIRYTRHSLQDQLNRAELKSTELRYLYHWVVPLKLAVRVREQLLHITPSLPSASGGVTNALAYWISRLEQKTLSRLRPPFGSSLLLVARRQSLNVRASDPEPRVSRGMVSAEKTISRAKDAVRLPSESPGFRGPLHGNL